jgi:hypothetical protein
VDRPFARQPHRPFARKLARAPGGENLIVTVRNKGFLLACDVTYV